MWFDDKIFEADTTEDQSGTPMEKVLFWKIQALVGIVPVFLL